MTRSRSRSGITIESGRRRQSMRQGKRAITSWILTWYLLAAPHWSLRSPPWRCGRSTGASPEMRFAASPSPSLGSSAKACASTGRPRPSSAVPRTRRPSAGLFRSKRGSPSRPIPGPGAPWPTRRRTGSQVISSGSIPRAGSACMWPWAAPGARSAPRRSSLFTAGTISSGRSTRRKGSSCSSTANLSVHGPSRGNPTTPRPPTFGLAET